MRDEEDPIQQTTQRGWAYAGLLAALLLLPALHLAAVDFEDRTTSPASYLEHIDARDTAIALAAGVGLLLTCLVVVHLAGLRRFAGDRHPVLADASVAVGGLAVLGLAISFVSAGIAAYGPHEHLPFEVVNTLGVLAEGFVVWLLPALAGPAALIAVLALRDHVLPRLLGYTAAAFTLLLSVLGVVLPGVGALPALLWFAIMTATLSLHRPAGST